MLHNINTASFYLTVHLKLSNTKVVLFSTGNNFSPKPFETTEHRVHQSYNHHLLIVASEIVFMSWTYKYNTDRDSVDTGMPQIMEVLLSDAKILSAKYNISCCPHKSTEFYGPLRVSDFLQRSQNRPEEESNQNYQKKITFEEAIIIQKVSPEIGWIKRVCKSSIKAAKSNLQLYHKVSHYNKEALQSTS